jgi:Fungal N-terminal domain of STAND proteins
MEAAGFAASIGGLTELSLKVYTNLSKYIRRVKNAPKLAEELRQELLLISDVLEELEVSLESAPLQETKDLKLEETIKQFEEIITTMVNLNDIKKGEWVKRLRWPFTENENQDFLTKLERFKNTITLTLSSEGRSYSCYKLCLLLQTIASIHRSHSSKN